MLHYLNASWDSIFMEKILSPYIGLFIKNVIKRLDDTDQSHLTLTVRIFVFGMVVKISTPYGEE